MVVLAGSRARAGEGLLLGDGKASSQPQVGYIWSCMQQKGGGGAFRDGPWIQGKYWYPDQKINVQGDVDWESSLSITVENGLRVIRSNDLPKHGTGIFPVQRNDPAYNYDRNPNSIRTQQVQFFLPANPQEAQYPSCTGGAVGFSLSGAWIFDGMDAEGRDAPAHEVQDKCNGHPQEQGQYHYHGPSPCMKDASGDVGRHSDLVAYAFDGFGIYGEHGENGKELRSADLDACHGHKHMVMWDGKMQEIYHYHMTPDFPYSVGCFKGSYVNRQAERGQTDEQGRQLAQQLQWQAQQQQWQQWQQQQQNPQQGQWNGQQQGNGQQNWQQQGGGQQMQQNASGWSGYSGAAGQGQQQQGYGQQQRNPLAILQGAAQRLGVDAQTLRNAIGGPPPDFNRASQALGIPADQIHQAFINAGAPN